MSIKQQIENLREVFVNKITEIKSRPAYWERPPVGTIEDEFGTYEILDNSVTSYNDAYEIPRKYSFVISKHVYAVNLHAFPSGVYVNFKYNGNSPTVYIDSGSSANNIIKAPVRLILPDNGSCTGADTYFRVTGVSFSSGLYLSDAVNIAKISSWITDDYHLTQSAYKAKVKFKQDFGRYYSTVTVYLNKLLLDIDYFVKSAAALYDYVKYNTGKTGKIVIGNANLDRMTTAQKNVFLKKGWELS